MAKDKRGEESEKEGEMDKSGGRQHDIVKESIKLPHHNLNGGVLEEMHD